MADKTSLSQLFTEIGTKRQVDPGFLATVAKIESNLDPKAVNPGSKAAGLFQFIPGTANEEGIDPHDPTQATEATARRFRRFSKRLLKGGFEPTALNLYLTHQQGLKGFSDIAKAALGEGPLSDIRRRNMRGNLPKAARQAFDRAKDDTERASTFLISWAKRFDEEAAEAQKIFTKTD